MNLNEDIPEQKLKELHGLFIFRRDLRIVDNIGLTNAIQKCKHLLIIFIFTPEQITKSNEYRSLNCIQFMLESLLDLQKQLRHKNTDIYCFYGHNDSIIRSLIRECNINCVFFNADITPYAIERDESIRKICEEYHIPCELTNDYFLHQPGTIVNKTGKPYQKFTPYYHACLSIKHTIPKPLKVLSNFHPITNSCAEICKHHKNFVKIIDIWHKIIGSHENPNLLVHGGRTNAILQLKKAAKNINGYSSNIKGTSVKQHDMIAYPTSQLSAFIKFGCVSIREVYYNFSSNTDFIRQLYWREMYANVLYSFPYVLKKPIKENYAKLKWNYNERWFKAWTEGQTGFPIIDASMRYMNKTGYMHNRSRLIVSSFLVKTLLLNWKKGEKYFANTLVDYDVANNNGNWAWIMGGGIDSNPWFRIFSPWRQQEMYDPKCTFILEWIPELRGVPIEDIHHWDTEYSKYPDIKYIKPICNYVEQREKALDMYRQVV